MTSPFRFKYPFPSQVQPTTPSTQLSSRNFLLPNRLSYTPSSSLPSTAPHVNDEIDDSLSDDALDIPRKRTRYSSVHDVLSDDDDGDNLFPISTSAIETPMPKRPPVILPLPSPESPPIDFSPSRRQAFQPNGLAAFTAKIIHEHNALSSVSVPRLDQEDTVSVTESRTAEGDVGWICRVNTSTGTAIVLFLVQKGLAMAKEIDVGDCLAVSNPVKRDTIWICSSWHHKSV
jgi:hypothetical protein